MEREAGLQSPASFCYLVIVIMESTKEGLLASGNHPRDKELSVICYG